MSLGSVIGSRAGKRLGRWGGVLVMLGCWVGWELLNTWAPLMGGAIFIPTFACGLLQILQTATKTCYLFVNIVFMWIL
jgi:hypothetical protein